MKNIFLLLILISSAAIAQPTNHHDKDEKIKAYKIAHITEALSLTTVQAEKFWPIYNLFEAQRHELKKQKRKEIHKPMRDGVENLTDAQANAIITAGLALEFQELELRKKLVKDLGAIIPAKKIALLFKAEEDFKRKLLERYKSKRGKKE